MSKILEAQTEKRKVHFCYIDGQLSSQECRVRIKAPKNTNDESCSKETVKDNSSAYAVFPEQGSAESQMTQTDRQADKQRRTLRADDPPPTVHTSTQHEQHINESKLSSSACSSPLILPALHLREFFQTPSLESSFVLGRSRSSTMLEDRGVYLIDLDDKEYMETLKNARRKLERPMAAVTLCTRKAPHRITKVFAQWETASEKTPETIYGCIVEFHESRRQRVESSHPKNHEDHIASKGFTSMTHHNLVQKDENSACKSCRGQGMEKARDNPSMATGRSHEQEGGYSRSTKRQKESPFCFTDGHMSS